MAPRLTRVIAPAGRRARSAVARLELVRATGARYAVRRLSEESRLRRIGIDRYHSIYRSIWGDAARDVEAELVELGSGLLEIRKGTALTRVWLQSTQLDDPITLRVAEDKPLVHRLLTETGLPVPAHVEFHADDSAAARAFLGTGDQPLVVKPASGLGGGAAITTGVRTARDLERAVLRASRFGRRLVAERQAPGYVYRLLVLDGQLLDVVRRHPPSVTGDGRSSISELIAAENERRLAARGHAGISLMRVDLDCVLRLEAAGLTLRDVPAAGETVAVKTVTNQNRLEDNETVREPISPQLRAAAATAADTLGVRLAGVDMITTDLGRSLEDAGGVINEVNGAPGLNHHYHVATPASATPVAVPILRTLLAEGAREGRLPAARKLKRAI